MSISVRKDPNKINSVAGTFETYLDKGKTAEYITEALQKKDYTDAEIEAGYQLYLKSLNSNTTSLFFIGIAVLAIGILGYKFWKSSQPEVIVTKPQVRVQAPVRVEEAAPTEIPRVSMFDDVKYDNVIKLQTFLMKHLNKEYCEEQACEPTAQVVEFEARNRLLVLQGDMEKAKSLLEKARRRLIVMTDDYEIKKTNEEIKALQKAYEKAVGLSNPEQAKAEAAASLRKRIFRKLIYDDYEGLVIKKSFGPEPIGAYAGALKVYQKDGRLQFFNPEFEARFWKLFQPKARDRVMQQDSYDF